MPVVTQTLTFDTFPSRFDRVHSTTFLTSTKDYYFCSSSPGPIPPPPPPLPQWLHKEPEAMAVVIHVIYSLFISPRALAKNGRQIRSSNITLLWPQKTSMVGVHRVFP